MQPWGHLWAHSQHPTSTVFRHLSISFCPKILPKPMNALQILAGITPKFTLDYTSKGHPQPVGHGSQWINTSASCSSEQQFRGAFWTTEDSQGNWIPIAQCGKSLHDTSFIGFSFSFFLSFSLCFLILLTWITPLLNYLPPTLYLRLFFQENLN